MLGELGAPGSYPLLESKRRVNPGEVILPLIRGALGVLGLREWTLGELGPRRRDPPLEPGRPTNLGRRPRGASATGLGRARPGGWTLGELGPRGRYPLLEPGRRVDPGAHRCGAKGVLGLKDGRLVSWGFDGGIRFWSQEGLRFNSIKYGS